MSIMIHVSEVGAEARLSFFVQRADETDCAVVTWLGAFFSNCICAIHLANLRFDPIESHSALSGNYLSLPRRIQKMFAAEMANEKTNA